MSWLTKVVGFFVGNKQIIGIAVIAILSVTIPMYISHLSKKNTALEIEADTLKSVRSDERFLTKEKIKTETEIVKHERETLRAIEAAPEVDRPIAPSTRAMLNGLRGYEEQYVRQR